MMLVTIVLGGFALLLLLGIGSCLNEILGELRRIANALESGR